MTMANRSEPAPSFPAANDYLFAPWRSAYMAALFESDRSQLPERIRFAAQAILQRQQELLQQPSDSNERRALHNALNALRVLRDCTDSSRSS